MADDEEGDIRFVLEVPGKSDGNSAPCLSSDDIGMGINVSQPEEDLSSVLNTFGEHPNGVHTVVERSTTGHPPLLKDRLPMADPPDLYSNYWSQIVAENEEAFHPEVQIKSEPPEFDDSNDDNFMLPEAYSPSSPQVISVRPEDLIQIKSKRLVIQVERLCGNMMKQLSTKRKTITVEKRGRGRPRSTHLLKQKIVVKKELDGDCLPFETEWFDEGSLSEENCKKRKKPTNTVTRSLPSGRKRGRPKKVTKDLEDSKDERSESDSEFKKYGKKSKKSYKSPSKDGESTEGSPVKKKSKKAQNQQSKPEDQNSGEFGPCSLCQLKFHTEEELSSHTCRKYYQLPNKRWQCGLCPSNLSCQRGMPVHLRIHTGDKPFICKYDGCGEAFGDVRRRRYHEMSKKHENVRKNVGENPRPYICKTCGRGFSNASNLANHQLTHGEPKFFCTVDGCSRGFFCKNRLKYHLQKHNGEKVPCRVCGEGVFMAKRSQHEIRCRRRAETKTVDKLKPYREAAAKFVLEAEQQNGTFICVMCHMEFASEAERTAHEPDCCRFSKLGDNIWRCGVCGKVREVSLVVFKEHMKYHTAAHRFTCPHCPKSFLYKSDMLRHSKSHDGIKNFVCHTCGASYTTKQFFAEHLIAKHPEIPVESVVAIKRKTGQGRLRDRLRVERLGEGYKKRNRGPNRKKSVTELMNSANSNSSSQEEPIASQPIVPPIQSTVLESVNMTPSFFQQPMFPQPQAFTNYSVLPPHLVSPDPRDWWQWQFQTQGQTQAYQANQDPPQSSAYPQQVEAQVPNESYIPSGSVSATSDSFLDESGPNEAEMGGKFDAAGAEVDMEPDMESLPGADWVDDLEDPWDAALPSMKLTFLPKIRKDLSRVYRVQSNIVSRTVRRRRGHPYETPTEPASSTKPSVSTTTTATAKKPKPEQEAAPVAKSPPKEVYPISDPSGLFTKVGIRKWLCSGCPKTFKRRSHVRLHARVHSGVKPVTCPYCQKTFRQTATCIIHIRTHTNEKPYTCPVCFTKFRHQASFSYHKKTHGDLIHTVPPIPKAPALFPANQQAKRPKPRCVPGSRKQPETAPGRESNALNPEPATMQASTTLPEPAVHPDAVALPLQNQETVPVSLKHKRFPRNQNRVKNALARIDKDLPFRCEICIQTFETDDKLKEHACPKYRPVMKEDGFGMWQCAECLEFRRERKSMQDHVARHFPDPDSLKTIDFENAHVVESERGDLSTVTFKCWSRKMKEKPAGERVDDPNPVSRNTANIKFRRLKYICDVEDCREKFSAKNALIRHKRRVHPGTLNFKCSMCIKSFNCLTARSVHERKHLKQVWVVCEVCGFEFYETASFRRHMQRHQDGSPTWTCTICCLGVTTKHELAKHWESAHGQKLERVPRSKKGISMEEATAVPEPPVPKSEPVLNFKCDFCDMGFINARNRKRHRQQVHEGKVFTCSFCSKIYFSKLNWENHERKHRQGVWKYCEICGFGLWDQQNYDRHVARHSDPKLPKRKCPLCPMELTTVNELRMHTEDHEKKENPMSKDRVPEFKLKVERQMKTKSQRPKPSRRKTIATRRLAKMKQQLARKRLPVNPEPRAASESESEHDPEEVDSDFLAEESNEIDYEPQILRVTRSRISYS